MNENDLELDLDLDQGNNDLDNDRSKKRLTNLSEKVRITSEERDKALKEKEAIEAEKAALIKETEFFKNFNSLTNKYPGSAEYQDKIKEKVMSGYDVEDATISILAKEGKFQPQAEVIPKDSPAGGSATNTIKAEGDKPLAEMTQTEKRTALADREAELLQIFNPNR